MISPPVGVLPRQLVDENRIHEIDAAIERYHAADVDIPVAWYRERSELRRRLQTHAQVVLFKPGGKYYTEEEWAIPDGAIGPYDMERSPDFRRIGGTGAVLVESQEPWGYPHLFPGAS